MGEFYVSLQESKPIIVKGEEAKGLGEADEFWGRMRWCDWCLQAELTMFKL